MEKTNLVKFWEKCYYVDKPEMKYPPTILERLTRAKQFIDLTELERDIWNKWVLSGNKQKKRCSKRHRYNVWYVRQCPLWYVPEIYT